MQENNMNKKCYLCGTHLVKENMHKEHVIQNAIGGTLKPDDILCISCGTDLGKEIDAPFNEMFKSISSRLDIKTDRPINKSLTGSLGNIEVNWDNFKVTPRKPFHVYDEENEHLTIFAHPKRAPHYERGIRKEMDGLVIAKTTIVTDMSQYGEVCFPFELNNKAFKRGLAKIAAGFASYHGIQRTNLPLVIDSCKNSIMEDILVIPYFPSSPIERFVEISRLNIDSEFPHHSLLLFTEKFGTNNETSKKLICYIELFGTFQHYILLNDDFKGDDVYEWYGQKIFKKDEFKISGWPDLKTMHMHLSDIGLTFDDLNQYLDKKWNDYEERLQAGEIEAENQVEECVFRETKAKQYVEFKKNQERYSFDYECHINLLISNLLQIMQMEKAKIYQHLDTETIELATTFNTYFYENLGRMGNLLQNTHLYYSQTEGGGEEFIPNAYRRSLVTEEGDLESQFALSIEHALNKKDSVNSYGHMKFYSLIRAMKKIEDQIKA